MGWVYFWSRWKDFRKIARERKLYPVDGWMDGRREMKWEWRRIYIVSRVRERLFKFLGADLLILFNNCGGVLGWIRNGKMSTGACLADS